MKNVIDVVLLNDKDGEVAMDNDGHQHSDYRQNLLTLWFKDKRLEQAFRASHTRKTMLQVRIALILGAAVYTTFAVLDLLMLDTSTSDALVIRFAFAVPAFMVGLGLSFVDYFRKKLQFLVATLIFIAGIGVAIISIIYNETTSDIYLAGTLIPVVWAFMFSGLRLVAATIACLALICCYEIIFTQFGHYPYSSLISYNFFLMSIAIIGLFGGYTIERYYRKDFIQSRLIDEKRKENERLLLNILPAPIAEKLKKQPGTIATGHNDVTVLFADLVNFTQFTHGRSPVHVVDVLNEIFSRFDKLTSQYHLEKIKTIGDAYMVVGGLLDGKQGQLQEVAQFALAAQHQLKDFNRTNHSNIEMRIGIQRGPVIAGVIGVKKFTYDVWGETVNTASRLESTGVAGKIHISSACAEALKDNFVVESRGKTDLKGTGNIDTWFLIGVREGLFDDINNPSIVSPDKMPEQAALTVQ